MAHSPWPVSRKVSIYSDYRSTAATPSFFFLLLLSRAGSVFLLALGTSIRLRSFTLLFFPNCTVSYLCRVGRPASENKDFIFHQTPGTKAAAAAAAAAAAGGFSNGGGGGSRFLRCRFLSLFLLITPRCADCAVPLVSSDARNQDSG